MYPSGDTNLTKIMGSQAPPKIPTIDFLKDTSNAGSNAWLSVCNDIRCALEEYGCFIVRYDKISSELHNKVFGALEELFDLPLETKKQNTGTKPYHGYVGQYPAIPLHEGLGIEDATTLEGIQSFTDLMWPGGNDHFCETVHSYSKIVAELDVMLTKMVFESYGVLKYYESHMAPMTYLLRLMKYRERQMNETNVGFAPHTDKSFLTILYQNQIDGLEIETRDGEWIGFELSPSSFAVIAGDALMAWSNDRIQSPNHRVTMSGSKVRYSLGLFEFSNGIIQAPEELLDDEHPLRFKPFDHLGYLRVFYAHEGPKYLCPLRSYCGI